LSDYEYFDDADVAFSSVDVDWINIYFD
jgi:hypothetical protein